MDTNKSKKALLDKIDKVELELMKSNVGYAKECLEEEGFDVATEISFCAKHMTKVRFMAQAMDNKKRDQNLLVIAFDRLKQSIQENSQKATSVLVSMLREKSPSVQYRKLENWTDEEIKEVLGDVDLVSLLEKLESEGS